MNLVSIPIAPPEEQFRVFPPFDAADVYRQYLAKKFPKPGDELAAASGMLSLGCALDALLHASRVENRKLSAASNSVAAFALLMLGHVPAATSRARLAVHAGAGAEGEILVALLLRLSGDTLGALEATTHAGIAEPDPRAFVVAGSLHLRAGRPDRAAVALRRARQMLHRARGAARLDRTRRLLLATCDAYLALCAMRSGDKSAAAALFGGITEQSLAALAGAAREGTTDEADVHKALAGMWPTKRPEWRLAEAEAALRAAPDRETTAQRWADELAASRMFVRAADAYVTVHKLGGGAAALRSAAICAFRAGETARAKERFAQARTEDRAGLPSVFESYAARGWSILDYAEAMVESSRRALGQEHPRVALEHASVALDTVGEHPGARLAAAKALLALADLPGSGSGVSAIAAYQLLRSTSVEPRGLDPIVSVSGPRVVKRESGA